VFKTEKYDKCFKDCPQECQSKHYHMKKSEVSLGNPQLFRRLKQQIPQWENKSIGDVADYIRYIFNII